MDPGLARVRFGALAERMFAALHDSDPLADAAVAALDGQPQWLDVASRGETPDAMPAALRALVHHMSAPPAWVDHGRCDRAGKLLFRANMAGGIVLGARSLLAGYCAPAGNKPLAFSGRLEESVDHRLAETSRFVVATCSPGGMKPGAEAWGITLRVRLMHARVRGLLRRSPRWDDAAWGLPINQHDMVATSLLFSTVFVDGIRRFGVRVSPEEEEDYLHLWRVSGWLIGVREDLLPNDAFEARRLEELVRITQGPPDDDSRALVNALLESPRRTMKPEVAERHVAAGQGFARALLGDEMADALRLPKTAMRFTVPVVAAALTAMSPFVSRASYPRLEELGRRYWERSIAIGSGGLPMLFELPRDLRRAA